jgi:ribonuclease HI
MQDYTEGKISERTSLIGNFDGGCEPKNPGGVCTSAWVLYDGESQEKLAFEGKIVRDGGKLATNNFAEYCALGLMLKFLVDQNWRGSLHIYSDSKLVVNQVTENWKMKAESLKPLRKKIWEHLKTLELEVSSPDEEFECFTCNKKGPLDLLVDMEGDGEKLLCPSCHNIVNGFNAPTNCVIEWVRRENNEEADAIGRAAYQAYKRNKK